MFIVCKNTKSKEDFITLSNGLVYLSKSAVDSIKNISKKRHKSSKVDILVDIENKAIKIKVGGNRKINNGLVSVNQIKEIMPEGRYTRENDIYKFTNPI